MRVFALSTWCPSPTVNGSTLRAHHLLRARASRHDVDLVTFTVLEALALGTPVVSTRKGVEGLEVADNTHVLVADAPANFAAQVVRVLDDEMLAARLSAAGRRLIATSYTWDAVGRELLAVVNQVGAGKGL